MIILKEQHPTIHACVPLNDGPRRYLEVYITPQNDNNDIINQDIFNEANLRAYPRSSLDDTAKIVHLSLTTFLFFLRRKCFQGFNTV